MGTRLTNIERCRRCAAILLLAGGLIVPIVFGTSESYPALIKAEGGTQLSEARISSGAKLIQKLDERGILPEAAFWFYFSDTRKWKLVVAEVKLGPIEPKEIYQKIQETISSLGEEIKEISLDDVAVAPPQAPIVTLLRAVIRTGPGISGIRFTGNMINGTLVEDAYIYRLKHPES